MNNVLFILAHPDLRRSRANRYIWEQAQSVAGVTAVDLYETYPAFHIDVEREQEMLVQHTAIVWQHPIYWYGMPPLLKLWIDQVLSQGFAYGPGGTSLHGKSLQLSVTTGAGPEAYTPEGFHRYVFDSFLPPFIQTARLCGMVWQPPLILHGAHKITTPELERHAEQVCKQLVHLTQPQQNGVS